MTVGTRFFSCDLLFLFFREELDLLKQASIIEEWVEERVALREAQIADQATARGMAQGIAQGMAQQAREILLRLLRRRFGELPERVVSRVAAADAAWCESMAERVLDATSLEELGL